MTTNADAMALLSESEQMFLRSLDWPNVKPAETVADLATRLYAEALVKLAHALAERNAAQESRDGWKAAAEGHLTTIKAVSEKLTQTQAENALLRGGHGVSNTELLEGQLTQAREQIAAYRDGLTEIKNLPMCEHCCKRDDESRCAGFIAACILEATLPRPTEPTP